MEELINIYSNILPTIPHFINALFTVEMLIALTVGVVGGMIIGSLPGLNATTGIILLMPLTYSMSPIPALTMLMAIYTAGILGGSFASILINTPGTSSSIAALFDGYPMTQKGEALKALNTSIFSSTIGGIISALSLIFIAPLLVRLALIFDSPEYFLLAVLGITLVSSFSSDGLAKGFSIGCMGLLVGSIGLAPMSSVARYTLGSELLYDGFNRTVVIIGIFSIAQVMIMTNQIKSSGQNKAVEVAKLIGNKFLTLQEIKSIMPTILRSSIIGVGVGILPGAGAGTGSFLGYAAAKKSSKHPELFGTGIMEGVAAPEAANNAVTGAAMIPLMTLGIPGSTAAAVLLGALMIQGLQPGMTLFTNQAAIAYPIMFGFLVANIIMLPIGLVLSRVMGNIVKIPEAILAPIIVVLAVLGSFAIRGRVLDIYILIFFGMVGYIMKKAKFATASFTLGMLLGVMGEAGLRRSLVLSRGDIIGFYFSRPAAVLLILLILLNMATPLIKKLTPYIIYRLKTLKYGGNRK
ncbi:MAG: tripartite tricarboxylate transporter permease [Dethiosulfatibacter sp.]|nr:tripartite tricarboxylate transporter permease [Dethiosulfatibacter sp.]